MKFLLIKNFFVISEEAAFEHALITRKNVLSLVKHGFTREEIYYMPIGEYLDYAIKVEQNYNKITKGDIEECLHSMVNNLET